MLRACLHAPRIMTPTAATRHSAVFAISRDHPAIPGHFPGNPVVPGVVILHEVILAAGRWLGLDRAVQRLPYAKFIAPLLPGEDAAIELTRDGSTIAFSVTRGTRLVARGAIEFGAVPAP
jgi:3-hydroxymyristoyl/3-hydroxydecanoyl-(acyl carrier protein) dehydratase